MGLMTDHISPRAAMNLMLTQPPAVIILSEKENKPSPPKVHQTICQACGYHQILSVNGIFMI